ncbi:MAG: class I SAM-dependent methyltransferase [Ignavibacteriales bacterium]|nr:class I SAM-dependent methyltransferase [Ignavibacteriales bacterium]
MRFLRSMTAFFNALIVAALAFSQTVSQETSLDKRVKKFLDDHVNDWHDLNVPASDGKLLYDIVLKNKYTRALEIGTSTGHSTVWIAWALSKTGGMLITVEIDERRYKQALKNFEEAGLSAYIDARLADAHELAPKLDGPFDFVFSDADKEWYKNYFVAVSPKLVVNGCFTAHNVSLRRRGFGGIREFIEYVESLANYTTTIDSRGAGMSISYKTAPD